MAHDVFISHDSNDRAVAEAIREFLEGRRLRCWLAPRDVPRGDPYGAAIIDALNRSALVVLVLSRRAGESQWVAAEVERAVSKHIPVLSFRIDEAPVSSGLELFVSPNQWLDASVGPLEPHLESLAGAVEARLARQLRADSLIAASGITVHRVEDPDSEDLHEALKLYSRRIPESERFEAPDIVRWIRDDLTHAQSGDRSTQDYFLVAKHSQRVVGFLLLHYYRRVELAFAAYLVSERGWQNVSAALFREVRRLFQSPRDLKDCQGLLLEVDDPQHTASGPARRMRLARIRLFCTLAAAQGFSLRAFDIDYRQPRLSLDDPASVELPMLLMYARESAANPENHLSRGRVKEVLRFVYTLLYPEGYSDSQAECRAYRRHLRQFYATRTASLPERVRMLSYRQIKAAAG